MRKSIDKKTILRKLLQSLPACLAAIVFVIYIQSFAPVSADRQKRAAALVECASYFEVRSDGKAVARFSDIGADGMAEGMSPATDSSATRRTLANGVWVNKYPFMLSCNGLIITANGDSLAARMLPEANKRASGIIAKNVRLAAERLETLNKKVEEADYYMHVHNVNDDGYNTVAEYAERLKAERNAAERLLAALKKAQGGKCAEILLIRHYTLLYTDSAGTVKRKACRLLTTDATEPFALLQTEDGKKPDGTAAIDLHQWLTPHPGKGDSVTATAIPGCTAQGFDPATASAATFAGATTDGTSHDVPPLLAPDGAAIYTKTGFLAGISAGGKIFKPTFFGFGLKRLLK